MLKKKPRKDKLELYKNRITKSVIFGKPRKDKLELYKNRITKALIFGDEYDSINSLIDKIKPNSTNKQKYYSAFDEMKEEGLFDGDKIKLKNHIVEEHSDIEVKDMIDRVKEILEDEAEELDKAGRIINSEKQEDKYVSIIMKSMFGKGWHNIKNEKGFKRKMEEQDKKRKQIKKANSLCYNKEDKS